MGQSERRRQPPASFTLSGRTDDATITIFVVGAVKVEGKNSQGPRPRGDRIRQGIPEDTRRQAKVGRVPEYSSQRLLSPLQEVPGGQPAHRLDELLRASLISDRDGLAK